MSKTQEKTSRVPSVVILGGGTGTFVVASALKKLPVHVTAVLTMVDDGGSNKMLRDEFGLLPTSGIRQCIVALSESPAIWRELFTYRFHQGNGINGMTFGNLFMAAMADIKGDQKKGIEETCKLLKVKGTILPISYDDSRLVAQYQDGTILKGEHEIDEPRHDGTLRITKVWTEPESTISPEAKKAIEQADLIILGPGDFFTNTAANLIIKGVPEAIANSKGKVCFITNLMAKYGETFGYTLKDFMNDLSEYLPLSEIDYVLINNNQNYPVDILKLYEQAHDMPVSDNITEADVQPNVQLVRTNLLSEEVPKEQKGDVLKRSVARHSTRKIAENIAKILENQGFQMK